MFKNKSTESDYLARRAYGRASSHYRFDLVQEFSKDKLAKKFVKETQRLGRFPIPEEFDKFEELVEFFGSPDRIFKLAAVHLDLEQLDRSKKDRRSDVLLFLAGLMIRGIKPPGVRSLPKILQADIKSNWIAYGEAQRDAVEFLYLIGSAEAIGEAARSADHGKLLPEDFYAHTTIERELPPLLRLLVYVAKNIVGQIEYDVVKIRLDGKAVSFLIYDDFDHDPHPKLHYSVRVYLPNADFKVRDYSPQANRPILHRKDSLVGPGYPYYKDFKRLTEQEEKLGLLNQPNIGHEQQWRQVLLANKLGIKDHAIRKLA